jgi:hypothetical protein
VEGLGIHPILRRRRNRHALWRDTSSSVCLVSPVNNLRTAISSCLISFSLMTSRTASPSLYSVTPGRASPAGRALEFLWMVEF